MPERNGSEEIWHWGTCSCSIKKTQGQRISKTLRESQPGDLAAKKDQDVKVCVHHTLRGSDTEMAFAIRWPQDGHFLFKYRLATAEATGPLPDIIGKVADQEVLFGEITGPRQTSHTAKNAWDAFRLARFGKSFLDSGNSVAPLIQIIGNSGTYMRLVVRTRGMYLLQEVGTFEIPSKVSAVATFLATLQTLELTKIAANEMDFLKWSWGYGDLPKTEVNENKRGFY
ncbi:hypothetical protein EDD21DRAFT_410771 [Dissophora ornata]|nr:hypothetical protein EDD21DRAFT_410771 [Dissophora ornata]